MQMSFGVVTEKTEGYVQSEELALNFLSVQSLVRETGAVAEAFNSLYPEWHLSEKCQSTHAGEVQKCELMIGQQVDSVC